jgi:hypothetical protein
MKKIKEFVLSSGKFASIRDAERKVTQWFEKGTLEQNRVKLFKVVEMYDLKLKFVKRKK